MLSKVFAVAVMYLLFMLPPAQASAVSSLSLGFHDPFSVPEYSMEQQSSLVLIIVQLLAALNKQEEPAPTLVHFSYEFWQGCFDYFGYDKCTDNVCNDDGGGEGHDVCWPHDVYPPTNGCENEEVFCYDCGCSSFGSEYYCDGPGESPENHWECSLKPTDANFITSNQVNPPEYNPASNPVTFTYTITNYPEQSPEFVDILNERCTAECMSGGMPCTADCTPTQCDGEGVITGVENERSYTKQCGVNVTILVYSPESEYIVTPILSLEVQTLKPPSYARDHGGLPLQIPLSTTLSPVVFGTTFCGNGIPNEGETQENCCWDVVCDDVPEIEYCNGGFEPELGDACTFVSDITLTVDETVTAINICQGDAILPPFTVTVNNPPDDMELGNARFMLSGEWQDMTCTPQGIGVYSCTDVVIPQDIETCGGGDFPDITGNNVEFTIGFPNGFVGGNPELIFNDTLTLPLAPFPDIPIATFGLGDGACEGELGENQTNSCQDCGCDNIMEGYGSEYYCGAMQGGSEIVYSCTLSGYTMNIQNMDPTSRETHNPISGDVISFNYVIPRYPNGPGSGVDVVDMCTAVCEVTDHSQGSTDPCTLQLCEVVGESCVFSSDNVNGNGDLVNPCEVRVRIADYETSPVYTYRLELSLLATLMYYDFYRGQNEIHESLVGAFPDFNFGDDFCGDREVNQQRENSNNCCFDVGCGTGQFCDSVSNTAADADVDACATTNDIQLEIDSVNPSEFPSSSGANVVTVEGRITGFPNRPDAVDFQYLQDWQLISCSFVDMNEQRVECANIFPSAISIEGCGEDLRAEDLFRFSCNLVFPAISDFVENNFYDETQGKLMFRNGEFSLAVRYYDGFREVSANGIAKTAQVGDIIINVETACGDGDCHMFAEGPEQPGSCPLDCGCGDGMYLDPYEGSNGECKPVDDIDLRIHSVEGQLGALVLDGGDADFYCVQHEFEGDCQSLEHLIADVELVDAPRDTVVDLDPTDGRITAFVEGNGEEVFCEEAEEDFHYQCQLRVPKAEAFNEPGLQDPLIWSLVLDFNIDIPTRLLSDHTDTVVQHHAAGSTTFTYAEVKTEQVTREESCLASINELAEQGEMINGQMLALTGIVGILTIAGIIICMKWKGQCLTAMQLVSTITIPLLNSMSQLRLQLSEAETAREDACESVNVEELFAAENEAADAAAQIGGFIGGLSSFMGGGVSSGMGMFGGLGGLGRFF